MSCDYSAVEMIVGSPYRLLACRRMCTGVDRKSRKYCRPPASLPMPLELTLQMAAMDANNSNRRRLVYLRNFIVIERDITIVSARPKMQKNHNKGWRREMVTMLVIGRQR